MHVYFKDRSKPTKYMSKIYLYFSVEKGMIPLKRNIKKEDELADKAVAGCLEALKSMMTMNKGIYFSIAWCLNIVIFV